jgi:DNA-directed RNA polymerase beta subunit
VVYIQRLRHMVVEKAQARGISGPINAITRQPVKGRDKGGGIRFGEMERDSLLAYGASALLRDRLLFASDHYKVRQTVYCGKALALVSVCVLRCAVLCCAVLCCACAVLCCTSSCLVVPSRSLAPPPKVMVCPSCETLLSRDAAERSCRVCGTPLVTTAVPHVLYMLVHELAGAGLGLFTGVRATAR